MSLKREREKMRMERRTEGTKEHKEEYNYIFHWCEKGGFKFCHTVDNSIKCNFDDVIMR